MSRPKNLRPTGPVTPVTETHRARMAPPESGPRPHVPVLLVQAWDCGADCRETLQLWGFRAAATADIEEALRMVAEHDCRALVVDLDLPRVDVLALVTALRTTSATRDVTIVATTRGNDEAIDALARESGCDVVLTGAIDPHALAMELEAALAHPGRRCAVA